MKGRECERCAKVGEPRWIDDLLRSRKNQVGAFYATNVTKPSRKLTRRPSGTSRLRASSRAIGASEVEFPDRNTHRIGRFRSRAIVELENLTLRRQLHVLRRQRPGRLRLFAIDRLLWVRLYRWWPRCLECLLSNRRLNQDF
jgi:hypothetical protein